MGLFDSLFGKNSNASKSYGPNADVVKNARSFISMCKKIDALGRGWGFQIIKEETSYGTAKFYIKHTFYNVDDLVSAQNWLKKGESMMVEYCYNSILKKAQLTPDEQGFFLWYLSDFCDFLRGGIPNYNQCVCEGLNEITIIQSIGMCRPEEVTSTYSELKYVAG
ncbi:MAG: hypothetical protein J6A85_04415 [Clostridia bacterium]|nr:hypothetical protein [Clostridia bacterium]